MTTDTIEIIETKAHEAITASKPDSAPEAAGEELEGVSAELQMLDALKHETSPAPERLPARLLEELDLYQFRAGLHQNKPDTEYTDEEIEDMNDAQAHEVADKIARIIGTRWADRPKVLARVVEIYSGRRLPEVMRELQDRNHLENQGWEGEDEFPDF